LGLRGVVSPSLLFHARVKLARIGGHARTPATPCKSAIYGCGRVSYLLFAQGLCVSCSRRGICCCVHGILRAGIWCAITSISPLAAAVLWLGAASLDSFGDPAYGGLYDLVHPAQVGLAEVQQIKAAWKLNRSSAHQTQ
jgi:hypothetical protein